MELAKKPAIALFLGFIIGLVLWVYSLVYIEDKPVPNAVFTQSIIDTKIQAARDLRESTKVVFVGGSNVLFGVDSKLFSEITKQPALNFGCAAGMGPELILELLLPYLYKGDLVVMRWEYGHFRFQRSGEVNLTYLNLLSGPQSGFKKELPIYDRLSLSMAVPFAHIRNAISTHYNPFVAADVYKCKWNIDSLGNIRENNGTKMSLSLYTPSDQNLMEEYTISSDAQEIFSNFVDSCRNKGVRVIISWPNIYRNPLYLDHKVPQEKFGQIKEFWASLGLLTLGEPQDYFFDHSLVYDTLYHLNSDGVIKCTSLLAEQLKPALADMISH